MIDSAEVDIERMNRIQLVKDRDKWRALVNATLN